MLVKLYIYIYIYIYLKKKYLFNGVIFKCSYFLNVHSSIKDFLYCPVYFSRYIYIITTHNIPAVEIN